MGHNLNPFNPKHDLEKALDPAGSTIRVYNGNPTNARTVLDPGNAVWPQAAPSVPYATRYTGPMGAQIPAGAPLIDPKTNMRAGSPMVSSIGGLGGKNQIPAPAPQPVGSGGRVSLNPVQIGPRAM